jgi:ATP-dependent RNA circularization protein (DNA/RNA ligase family)
MFSEYHKIAAPFKRQEAGARKLNEGIYLSDTVKYLKDNKWIFTEKVDGTNIRVCWDGHSFSFRGRTDAASLPARLVLKLQQIFLKDGMEELVEEMFGDKEVIFFGEGYGVGIQAVGKEYIADDNDFILFDIKVAGSFLDQDAVVEVGEKLGLKMVPVLLEGTIEDAVNFVKSEPISKVGTCVIEGVVGRPITNLYDKRGNRVIVKIKCKDFEKNS